MLTLITGGARSGKSRFAQSLCGVDARVVYIATAVNGDSEMQSRIQRHQSYRPASWQTLEEPLNVAEAVAASIAKAEVVLLDCLTIWLSNLLYELRDTDPLITEKRILDHVRRLIAASQQGKVIAVTNEVGSAVVPDNPLARLFRDIQGMANQQIASASDLVYFVVSGVPIRIKSNGVQE